MLVSSLITVLGLAFVVGILYHYFQGQLMGELKKEAVYISRGVESTGTDYLKKLNDEDSRITYVDESGKVIYDNEANVESMDNHGHRKEIREAEINGEGADERMSSTLSEKTMYYAVRLENGNVLRVSSNQASVWMLLLQLLPPFAAVLILMLLLSGVFASRLSGKVVEPLNGLDLEHPDENDAYDEVQPLLSKIGRQSRQIRLQLEAARRQQKEFSIITENMQEGLLVIDRYTMVLSVNSSVGKLLKVKEIKTEESVYLLNRSEEFRGVVRQVLEGKHENKILRLDGSEIQVIANPVTRENKTEGAVILLVDVTEKVEREQLRREFSANVSHELKTPLTSISGFAEIMQDGFVKDEDVKVFAGRIYKEAQRLIRLVGDVIRISRLDEGGLPYQWEKLDLYSLTHDIFSTLHEAAEKQEVHMYMEGGSTVLDTVPTIMEEVLYNVCDNAVKYNRRGGEVFVRLKDGEDAVRVNVRDTGIGIPKEDQERIFERFYRVDKSHSKEIGGTGLGLSIVKHGVKTLNGRLWLNSEPGQGTEIIMEFPKHHMEEEAAE
ncbi:histidine kinase [Blautia sp. CLA-AA-H217]|uniref:histidine kinase n=2 Tax=Blautia fusiformis TaxID=2881264 RepID=A0AAW4WBB2_9FIRM|nr:ATP-binding protein [Blautia fusiformis]MCC2228697.1 histidine kinase [Blautia fusiformis]